MSYIFAEAIFLLENTVLPELSRKMLEIGKLLRNLLKIEELLTKLLKIHLNQVLKNAATYN
uniref:Uncharacterized protein n=1 Tax=Romanomermis culicivorax TaxID=13658 RepID=A0A915K4F3_ROMCU